jgi:hypothetical protein
MTLVKEFPSIQNALFLAVLGKDPLLVPLVET